MRAEGGIGGIPSTLKIFGEISSDFFKYTPPNFKNKKNKSKKILYNSPTHDRLCEK
jgi:hypothetical protein